MPAKAFVGAKALVAASGKALLVMDHLLKPVQALVWANAKELLAAPSSIWQRSSLTPGKVGMKIYTTPVKSSSYTPFSSFVQSVDFAAIIISK
ncbi:hypothetical protein GH714_043981 [Hevea brasiliensis]|uniref:Uncharacterized protein n=1 Tax=Hevea brasiliensis TaxID=3981 RepID=A0A6A6K1R8_HEVBR|nr:hypothetical protein GH714_043981 [Hevea brasiliensis]